MIARLRPRFPSTARRASIGVLAGLAAACGGATLPTTPGPVLRTHPGGVVAATHPIEGTPYGVAVSRTGLAYVALIGTSHLARGDVSSPTFDGPRVAVGSTPPHVVFDPAGTTAYATLQTGRGLAIVDVAADALVATLPLETDGFNLAVAPDGRRVYVTTAGGELVIVDAASRRRIASLYVGPAANGLVFSPDGGTLYVSSRDAGRVSAVDVASATVTAVHDVGGMPQRLAIAPDGKELYVANETSGLDVVDLRTGAIARTSFGTAGYGLGVTPDGEQLYVLLPAVGEVRVLDRATRAPVRTIAVGGTPRNVAFAADGRTALVTNESAVVVIR